MYRVSVFGPVVSRRLGVSLGVCTVPLKTCSYSCVYCQLGPTPRRVVVRRPYGWPEAVAEAVSSYLERLVGEWGGGVDYVTFIGYGEPTLDSMIGRAAEAVKSLGLRVAVFTNSSTLPGSLEDLLVFDLVSVKLDAADEDTWARINRPHPLLRLDTVLGGLEELAAARRGVLLTETMLVAGVNDSATALKRVAERLAGLNPLKAYISLPLRPPAEPWVRPPQPRRVVEAYMVFRERLGERVEILGRLEEPRVGAAAGDPVEALERTASMHPLRLREALGILERMGADPGLLDRLVSEGRLVRVEYLGEVFILAAPHGWGGGGGAVHSEAHHRPHRL